MRRMLTFCMFPLLAATSMQVAADSGAGCGLGKVLFEGQSGLGPHVLAATTNGSYSNNLFGISFDSLGCNSETVITASFQRSVFVAGNFDNIAVDAAQGGGEHLQSLASLMKMTDQDAERFFSFTQQRYNALFSQPVTDYEAWLVELDAALMKDPDLSQYALNRA